MAVGGSCPWVAHASTRPQRARRRLPPPPPPALPPAPSRPRRFEQKAVAVLLTMLSLGVRNIRLGPRLPAFLTPDAIKVRFLP
jgi:hypothetical protein